MSTFMPMLICTLAARYNLVFVEIIPPLNMICRGIVSQLIRNSHKDLECIPPILNHGRSYAGLAWFMADFFFLRSNFAVMFYITIPLFAIVSVINTVRGGAVYDIEGVCTISKKENIFNIFVVASVFPISQLGLYSMVLFETKHVLLNESMLQQQKLMLEILARQNDGVVLFQKSALAEEGGLHEKALFKNKAFDDITEAQIEDGLNAPFLQRKSEEMNEMHSMQISPKPNFYSL